MASFAFAPAAFFIVLRPRASELASDSVLQKISRLSRDPLRLRRERDYLVVIPEGGSSSRNFILRFRFGCFFYCPQSFCKQSFHRTSDNKKSRLSRDPLRLRRERDSNPRSRGSGTTVFETAPFGHSGISPESCKGKFFSCYPK